MAAPAMYYYAFNFTDAKLQYNVAGTLTEVDILYANKLDIKTDDDTITFEGDGSKRNIYITSGLTVTLSPDAIPVAALGAIFGMTEITTGVPNSGTHLNWFLTTGQAAGVSAGIRAVGSAIKSVAGVETTINLNLWVPLGTLTFGSPGSPESLKKWGQMDLRLGAVRTTVDVGGNALPTVPAGGAMYAIYET
jgi:hypothetical protein